MLYDFRLPRLSPHMSGARLSAGSKFLDISVDLGSAFAQDCPPISYYRVVLREALWLRMLAVAAGAACDLGQPIAIFSSEPDEPADGAVARGVRVATAGIVYHAGMWSGGNL